ncbi:MAG TPA: histidinol-phosphate transaminase [Cyclobacteriaceae bacterium]|nr:histidinol-phosphate transaminase [Cyclobacteriaceae bacterium]
MKRNFDFNSLVRKNIIDLVPYSSARDEFKGEADIFLDANENPYPSPYNRYPDPLQMQVKEKLSKIKGVPATQTFLGNGSDEAIDLLIRAFCEPYKDSILITDPTYGMYKVCADVNAVNVKRVTLTADYDLDVPAIMKANDVNTKIIFLCSPNNPSGNVMSRNKIIEILNQSSGLVVIDEAYIDFSTEPSFTRELNQHPNLVILQTFSKAWGLAGLRLGICFSSVQIIDTLNKIKYPYNVNIKTQELALTALDNVTQKQKWVKEILIQREMLRNKLLSIDLVEEVFPSDANFLLVKVRNAPLTYKKLMDHGIIVRDRSKVILCDNCLRITVGTPSENKKLIEALNKL